MTFYLKHMKSNKHTYIQFIIILKFIKYHFKETVGILLVFHSSDVEKKPQDLKLIYFVFY